MVDSMKIRINIKLGLFAIFAFQLLSCERDRGSDPIRLFVSNNSNDTIEVVSQISFPDTSLIENLSGLPHAEVLPNSEEKVVQFIGWENWIKRFNTYETLTLIIYSGDTLRKYPFSQIQNDYNILKRYELSIEQLRSLDWKITYP
jgi:hypothetical protein